MNHAPAFIDIHCHLLPGLDDGAADWDEAVAMAEIAAADGIAAIVATPHQLDAFARNDAATIRAAAGRLQQLLDRRRIALRVLPGGEVRIEPDLPRKLRDGEILTLGDRRRHVLLELPHEVFLPLERLLAELRDQGLTGILAHPERNGGILRQPQVLRPLVEDGLLLQATAGSFLGAFGPQVQALAESLLAEGLIHLVASDAHGTTTRRPLLSEAFIRIAQLADRSAAVELCCRNPARVVAGERLEIPRNRHARTALLSRLRCSKVGAWLMR
jgi:protein-tyrosine phosphatase